MVNFIPAMAIMLITVALCYAVLLVHPEMSGAKACLAGFVIGFSVGGLAVPVILRNYT